VFFTKVEELFKSNNYATDKLSAHSYIPVYERLFQKRKENALAVLEIGIGSGGSLQLWNDYFTTAEIYGIDLYYTYAHLDRFQRIHQIKDDAYTEQCVLTNFIEKEIKLDVVIDDGPHNKKSQMLAVQLYFPLLKDDGVIVIEDVQDHLNPGRWVKDIVESLPRRYQEFAQVIDLRHLNKSPDDLLIVLDKSQVNTEILGGN
jgi:hypothetical protein